MALYNNGYPMNYSPYYSPTPNYMAQQVQQPIQSQQVQQPTTQQIQSGGFIPVPSEDVARNYPVAPGNSVTFKNENAPYVYTKTMGFSQLDRPIFEKYKLVREEDPVTEQPQEEKKIDYSSVMEEMKEHFSSKLEGVKSEYAKELEKLWGEINVLKERISKPKPTALSKKKEGGED